MTDILELGKRAQAAAPAIAAAAPAVKNAALAAIADALIARTGEIVKKIRRTLNGQLPMACPSP